MSMFALYFMTRSQSLSSWLSGFGIVFGAIAIIAAVGYLCNLTDEADALTEKRREEAKDNRWTCGKVLRRFGGLAAVCIISSILCPTNKEWAVIIAASYATQNEELQKTPTKAAQVLNKFLDEYLEDGAVAVVDTAKKAVEEGIKKKTEEVLDK